MVEREAVERVRERADGLVADALLVGRSRCCAVYGKDNFARPLVIDEEMKLHGEAPRLPQLQLENKFGGTWG